MRTFHIIAEGIGFGHVSRCSALAKELEKYGKVKLFTFGEAYNFAKEQGLDAVKLNFKFALKGSANGINIEKNVLGYIQSLNPLDFAKMISIMDREKPEVVFVDSNLTGLAAARLHGKSRIFFIANNTDLSIFTRKMVLGSAAATLSSFIIQTPERIFVPDFPPPYSISSYNINYFSRPEKFSFVGPLAKRIQGKSRKHNFVTLGGTENKLSQVIASSKAEFVSASLRGKNIRKVSASEYAKYFSEARVVISHGGHTTIMEALLAGKPLLILHDGAYMERVNNARRVAELGLGVEVDARFADEKVLEKALDDAADLKSNCVKFSKFARKYDGAKEIARKII